MMFGNCSVEAKAGCWFLFMCIVSIRQGGAEMSRSFFLRRIGGIKDNYALLVALWKK
jgi:hypothetical protein